MRHIKNIHFIGIGGAGMGGIAEVLYNQGYSISGSDISVNAMVERLSGLGIEVKINHTPENVNGADVVVITSAIDSKNPELLAAKAKGVPIIKRAEMLAELMRLGQGVAIAGTHGKTTTTSILASIMGEAKLDPTFVIGGKLNSIGANAKLGGGAYFVAEADESDASFLHLNPVMVAITNIDKDHMGTYQNNFDNLKKVFINFLSRLPFYGLAVLNIDDHVIREIIPELRCQVITYGQSSDADYQLVSYQQKANKSYFSVYNKSSNHTENFVFNLPGLHNCLNALAALAICLEEDIDVQYIKQALEKFTGIYRRFQVYEKVNLSNKQDFTLIDDYGHHPGEISAMLSSISSGWPDKRLVMVFQPHRYTRTRDLFQEFVDALSKVPVLILLPVYPASEEPIDGASSHDLYQAINNNNSLLKNDHNCYILNNFDEVIECLNKIVLQDDIVLVQGAGDVSKVAEIILNKEKS